MLISFRMPDSWRGKVSDQQLLAWLREYTLQRPALPADPGPGRFKRSFRLPDSGQALIQNLGGHDSSFLRRLIGFHLDSQPVEIRVTALQSLRPVGLVTKRRSPPPQPPRTVDVSFSQVVDRSLVRYRSPILPPILSEPCSENGYSPVLHEGQLIRMPRTIQEERAWAELMETRQREEQRRRHAWEMRVGAVCTCGLK